MSVEEDTEPNFSRILPGADCGLGAPRRFITREWIDWYLEKYEGIKPWVTGPTSAVAHAARRLVQEEFAEADWLNKEPVCAPNQNIDGREDVEIYIYHVERTRV